MAAHRTSSLRGLRVSRRLDRAAQPYRFCGAEDEENSVNPGAPRSACRPLRVGNTAAVRGALLYFDGALDDEPAWARSHTDHPADSNATNAVIVTRHLIQPLPRFGAGPKPLRRFLGYARPSLTVQDLVKRLKYSQRITK
jgi:hypothetical protein